MGINVGIDRRHSEQRRNDDVPSFDQTLLIIYKRDGIDLWSTITNFQIMRRAAWTNQIVQRKFQEKTYKNLSLRVDRALASLPYLPKMGR